MNESRALLERMFREANREALVERTADANRQAHSCADLVFQIEGAKEAGILAGHSEPLALNAKAGSRQGVAHGVEDPGMRQRIPGRGCTGASNGAKFWFAHFPGSTVEQKLGRHTIPFQKTDVRGEHKYEQARGG